MLLESQLGYSDIETGQETSGEVVIPPTHFHVSQHAAGECSLKRRLLACISMKTSPWVLFSTCALIIDPESREVNKEEVLCFAVTIIKSDRRVKVNNFQMQYLAVSLGYKHHISCKVFFCIKLSNASYRSKC